MSIVRVYKSTDPGAPPHPSALRGSMAALLRACLVVGYGSGEDAKAPAGWEEPFTESGNYAVFRALTGARQFFQIDDNQADADVTAVRAFESMSDVTTGSGQWVLDSDTARFLGKRVSGTDSFSSEWIVIADETTCYLFLSGRYGLEPFSFGEFQSYIEDNPYRSFFVGHTQPGSLPDGSLLPFFMVGASLVSTGYVYLHRGYNYSTRASISWAPPYGRSGYSLGSSGFISSGYYNGSFYPVLPLEFGGGSLYFVYGRVRGIFYPCANQPKNHKEQFIHDGKTFLVLNCSSGIQVDQKAQLWIDITGSWT